MTNSFLSRCYCCCYCLLLFVDAQNVLNNFVTDKQYFGAIKKRCLVLFNWWTTVVYISSHINFISLCFLFEITFSSICLVYGDGFLLGSILFDTRDAPFFTCAKKSYNNNNNKSKSTLSEIVKKLSSHCSTLERHNCAMLKQKEKKTAILFSLLKQ